MEWLDFNSATDRWGARLDSRSSNVNSLELRWNVSRAVGVDLGLAERLWGRRQMQIDVFASGWGPIADLELRSSIGCRRSIRIFPQYVSPIPVPMPAAGLLRLVLT